MAGLLDRARQKARGLLGRSRKEKKDEPGAIPSIAGTNGTGTQQGNPTPAPQIQAESEQQQPIVGDGQQESQVTAKPATTSGQLSIALRNDTDSSNVYAYITGQALDRDNALFLLSADAETPYYPSNTSTTGTKLAKNVSIDLGKPGNIVHAKIPRIAGGRVWFSVGAPLYFALNPGPGLVEPSVFNEADLNHSVDFGFAEFTFNNAQVFVNISYVDFVGLPIALTLKDTNGAQQHVSGMTEDGRARIAQGLREQTAKDGRRWSSLIVERKGGGVLRILSPNSGILLNPTMFETYWTDYVNRVWSHFSTQTLSIDTQASFGPTKGRVDASGKLDFGANGSFSKPSAADIFSCSSGPFATGDNPAKNAIIPRLAAAFNRSTLLLSDNQPDGVAVGQYYRAETTNHYARVVHNAQLDGHGYAFPYDDVTPDGGVPQEGAVFSYSPALLTVSVGGRNARVGA